MVLRYERIDVRPIGLEERPFEAEDARRRSGVDGHTRLGQVPLEKRLHNQAAHRVTHKDRFFVQSLDGVRDTLEHCA